MYNAFISYSHAAEGKLAPALQTALEKFAKPWYKIRYLNVFRDEVSLTASPHLWTNIQNALSQSEFLIYLASPASASSKWITKEIEFWMENKSIETLLIVLTDGEIIWDDELKSFSGKATNALPDILEDKFFEEPFYIDLRETRTHADISLNNPIFKKEVLKLAAHLHGKEPKDLASEEVFAHRKMIRIRNIAVALLTILFITASGTAWLANLNAKLANKNATEARANLRQARINQQRADSAAIIATEQRDSAIYERKKATTAQLIAENQRTIANNKTIEVLAQKDVNLKQLTNSYWNQSQAAGNAGNYLKALLFSAEAVAMNKSDEIKENLLEDIEPGLPVASLENIIDFNSNVKNAAFSQDGKKILMTDADGKASIWDAETGNILTSSSDYGTFNSTRSFFSPDGKRILTASYPELLRLWDVASHQLVSPETKFDGLVRDAFFSPDLKKILLTGDSFAILWNPETGALVNIIKIDNYTDIKGVFSANSKQILTNHDGIVQLWDAQSGKLLADLIKNKNTIESISFSNDSKQILTVSHDAIQLWNTGTAKLFKKITNDSIGFLSAVFDPTNTKILANTENHSLILWDILTGKQISVPMVHDDFISCFSFSADGKKILTASNDKIVRLWETVTGRQIGPDMKHDAILLDAEFSPDEKKILTISLNKTARIWLLGSNIPHFYTFRNSGIKPPPAFSTDGKKIALIKENSVKIFGTENGKQAGSTIRCETEIIYTRFSPDGKKILIACTDKSTRLWNVETGKPEGAPMKHPDNVLNSVFSSDSKKILTSCSNHTSQVWNALNSKLISDITHQNPCDLASFSPDAEEILVVNGLDCEKMLDEQKKFRNNFEAYHNNAVFSPDGKTILTTGYDFTVCLYETSTGRRLGDTIRPEFGLGSAFISAINDTRHDETVTIYSAARLWDAGTGKPIGSEFPVEGSVYEAKFSNNGKRILTFGQYGNARVWETRTRYSGLIGLLMKHNDDITSGVFSPDDSQILTAAEDQSAGLWDAGTAYPIGPPMKMNENVNNAVFSPDGKKIVTAGDSAMRIWMTGTGKSIGPVINLQSSIFSVAFNDIGNRVLVVTTDSVARSFDIEADMDIPGELFKLQANVATGCELNLQTNELDIIPSYRWFKLKKAYDEEAEAHYKKCNYREKNYWKRIHQEF